MLCGKNLILATKPYTQECRRKSWLYVISTFALLLFFLAGTLFAPSIFIKIPCSILAGMLIVRFFVIYHDYQHHSILQKSVPANILMTIFGIYILAPSSIWKRSHDYHHNHNSKLYSAEYRFFPNRYKKEIFSDEQKPKVHVSRYSPSNKYSLRLYNYFYVWNERQVFYKHSAKALRFFNSARHSHRRFYSHNSLFWLGGMDIIYRRSIFYCVRFGFLFILCAA